MVAENRFVSASSRQGSGGTIDFSELAGGPGENVLCPDMIGIRAVVTTDTQKLLSHPIFPRFQSIAWTCSGSTSGIVDHKTSTTLLGQLFNPCGCLPTRPWSERLTEILASSGFLPELQVFQILDTENSDGIPRKSLDGLVDVVLARSGGAQSPFAARFATTDASADGFYLGTVLHAVGVDEQFVNSDIHGENRTGLRGLVRNPDPKSSPTVSERTSLEQLNSRLGEPIVQAFMSLEGNYDGLSFDKPGHFECVVEAAPSRFDTSDEAAQLDSSLDGGTAWLLSKRFSRLPGGNYGFESDLETVGAVPVGKGTSCNAIESCGVEFAPCRPERIDVSLGTRTDLAAKRFQAMQLGSRGKRQGDFDCSVHLHLLQNFDGSDRNFIQPSVAPILLGDGDKP